MLNDDNRVCGFQASAIPIGFITSTAKSAHPERTTVCVTPAHRPIPGTCHTCAVSGTSRLINRQHEHEHPEVPLYLPTS